MIRTIGTSVISVIALLGVGCASSSQPPVQADTARDLAEMKERILELQEQATITDVEMARLREQIDELRHQLAGGSPMTQDESQVAESERPAVGLLFQYPLSAKIR